MHAVVFQPLARGVIGVATHGDDLQRVARKISRMLGEHSEGGAHFPTSAQDDQWAFHLGNEFAQRGRRGGQHGIKLRFVGDQFRQSFH